MYTFDLTPSIWGIYFVDGPTFYGNCASFEVTSVFLSDFTFV